MAERLASPPDWLESFTAHVASRYCPSRACMLITELGRLLADEHSNLPAAVLDRARRPGRSMGPLARVLEDFFTDHQLALATDHPEQLAAGRRRRRVDRVPAPLRPAVAGFCEKMLHARERARRAGTRARSDHTVETALTIVGDLAQFLIEQRGKHGWELVDIGDIEAFLAGMPASRKRRLVVLRQFFRFARARRLILVDPARDLSASEPSAFRGSTLTLAEQRSLFRRWTTDLSADSAAGDGVHPHEALVGMLALLHGASSQEMRLMLIDDVDEHARAVRLGRRPHPVPLDPASWSVLQRCLAHRAQQRTDNPHVIVTKGTKAGRRAASTAYLSHVLDPCGAAPRMIRSTRLVDLVNVMDPKLVAAAFGMDPQSPLIYLADHVDAGRECQRNGVTGRGGG
ncbi:integrase [Pseudonocardia benzenivorans]